MMETAELVAGRELDALVAEKVMGWRRVSKGEPYFWPTTEMVADLLTRHPDVLAVDYFPAPEFSTDIAAAWTVVEKLKLSVIPDRPEGWIAGKLDPQVGIELEYIDTQFEFSANADTAPLAICRAALLAVAHQP